MRYTTSQRDALLYIALVSMFCDHTAYLFPAIKEGLHSIGRIAFPMFAWSFAYVLAAKIEFPTIQLYRMLIVGGISQSLWNIYQPDYIYSYNIFFTFIASLCWIGSFQKDWALSILQRCILLIAAFWLTPDVDYNYLGILLIVGIYSYYKWETNEARTCTLACLFAISVLSNYPWAFLALPVGFIVLQCNWNTIRRMHPGFFYYAYISHMGILVGLKYMLK